MVGTRKNWVDKYDERTHQTWDKAQSTYYRELPDTSDKKTCTGLGWSIRLIKELTTISLAMWKNRCSCMHGHTKVKEKRLEKERLQNTIQNCYLNRNAVPKESHRMFSLPINDLLKKHLLLHLHAWIKKYEAHRCHADRCNTDKVLNTEEGSDESSVVTTSTRI